MDAVRHRYDHEGHGGVEIVGDTTMLQDKYKIITLVSVKTGQTPPTSCVNKVQHHQNNGHNI